MSDYLHGIETSQTNEINITIKPAEMSAVCIIGTTPKELEGYPKVTNYTELAQYLGSNLDGFTLAEAAETILKESEGADIYPINIYDRSKHTALVEKSITFTDNKYELKELDIHELVLKRISDEETTVLNLNTDYTFENNVITLKIENAENITASYKYFDITKITDSDVIGGVDENGKRSGLQKIYDIKAEWGVMPRIILAPGFSNKNVRNSIEEIAGKIRGLAFVDAPKGTNVPLVEKARLKETNGIDLTGSSEDVVMCLPYVKRYNSNQNTTLLKPLSPVSAGIRIRLDRERNIAKSIDNTVSKTILGLEFPIYFDETDKNADSNRLSAMGVVTAVNKDGEFRIWGSHSTAFKKDVNEGLMTFESAKRTRYFIELSIENSSFECIGENITQGFIDDVLNSINAFFAAHSNPLDRKNQIMYSGQAFYDPVKNPAEKIAQGIITFSYKHCPLASADTIQFEDVLDITIITKVLNS